MSLSAADVTACLVTRGDQPEAVERILGSLIFDKVIVWDNSVEPVDWKCGSRYLAAYTASTKVVYFQDDDVLVPCETQEALVRAYKPGVCVANWGHGDNPDGYGDLPLVGCGAIVDVDECWKALDRWAEHYPLDDDFGYEADFIVGVLYKSFEHVHLPFEIDMPVAQHPSRLVNQPWQKQLKHDMTQRARAIRDAA